MIKVVLNVNQVESTHHNAHVQMVLMITVTLVNLVVTDV
jgi:hypothetical protein